MEGVTILAQEAVRDFHFGIFFLMFLVITGGLFILTVITFEPDTINGTIAALVLSIMIGFMGGFITGRFANDPIEQYQVFVSEEVSMMEFYERYEIIDQDGLIFTVREKPTD